MNILINLIQRFNSGWIKKKKKTMMDSELSSNLVLWDILKKTDAMGDFVSYNPQQSFSQPADIFKNIFRLYELNFKSTYFFFTSILG